MERIQNEQEEYHIPKTTGQNCKSVGRCPTDLIASGSLNSGGHELWWIHFAASDPTYYSDSKPRTDM